MSYRFGDFVDATNRASSREEIFSITLRTVGELGYDRIAFAAASAPGHDQMQPDRPAPAIALNYPEDWIKHYFAREYQHIDPIVALSAQTLSPLIWNRLDSVTPLTPQQRTLFAEAAEAGLREGLSLPLYGPGNGAYLLSLVSSQGGIEAERDALRLRALAAQFFAAYHGVGAPAPKPIRLTDRERDCLTWSARGKSNWDIGAILAISEHTVDFHFRRALQKLGANNRIVAIVKAIRLGLISP